MAHLLIHNASAKPVLHQMKREILVPNQIFAKPIRRQLRNVALSSLVFLSGCAASPPPSSSGNAARAELTCPSAEALAAVPWDPSQLGSDPACLEADQRIRRGAALGSDVGLVLACLASSARDGEREIPQEVEDFVGREDGQGQQGGGVLFEVDANSLNDLPQACLPKEFVDAARASIAASDGERITIYLSPKLGPRDTRFSPGNIWGLPLSLLWGKGHREITAIALKNVKQPGTANLAFSSAAKDLLLDASQDVDLFCWTHMAPHAQSKLAGGLPEETAIAQQNWSEFVMTYLQQVAHDCRQPGQENTQKALYRLGFVLHSVQDLAAHQGRTNEEHAYNAAIEKKDPDETPGAFDLGVDISQRFLNRALAGPLAHCTSAFAGFSGNTPWPFQKNRLLADLNGPEKKAPNRDFTAGTYLAYKRSRAQFVPVKENPKSRVRWFGTDTLPKTCDSAPCSTLLDLVFNAKPSAPANLCYR